MRVLAGDVGGTKTLLQVADYRDDEFEVVAEKSYNSADFTGLVPIARSFLQELPGPGKSIDSACLAVAGPVHNQIVKITNLPWVLNRDKLIQQLSISRIRLINDMQGMGYGIDVLPDDDFEILQVGSPERGGARALIGAGTGLGEAMMLYLEGHYKPLPSEGGHVDFAPRDELELQLCDYLIKQMRRVSYEDLLSGQGLVHIFGFLHEAGYGKASYELQQTLHDVTDPAAVISEFALAGKDVLAELALDRFIRIYGAQAGNLALTLFATGGIYLVGGIAPRIIKRLANGEFMRAFLDNPRMSALLSRIPVRVVLNTNSALLGARSEAIRL